MPNIIDKKFIVLLMVLMLILVSCTSESSPEELNEESKTPNSSTSDSTSTQTVPIPSPTNVKITATVEIPTLELKPQKEDKLSINWGIHEEENGLFTIEYPQEWQVDAPVDLNQPTPVNVWQFRGEPISPQFIQNVTLGRYITPTIPVETSLERWFEQVDNNEFEFERLKAEFITVNALDAYRLHTRYQPPERDAYVTYIRCQNQVWFLHTLDIDLESTELESIYSAMLDSLSLNCGQ